MNAAYVYSIYAAALIGRAYVVYRTVDEVLDAQTTMAAATVGAVGAIAFIVVGMVARRLIELAR